MCEDKYARSSSEPVVTHGFSGSISFKDLPLDYKVYMCNKQDKIRNNWSKQEDIAKIILVGKNGKTIEIPIGKLRIHIE